MARRRKPINWSLINEGNKDELRRVVEDLSKKRPCGPLQNLHAEDYEEFYDEARLPGDRPHSGGYSDEQGYLVGKLLGCTGSNASEWDIRTGLRDLYGWSHFSKAGLTRRSRRLERRLSAGYRTAITEGKIGDGVWNVIMRDQYGHRYDISVVAQSKESAEQIAATLFGYALGEVQYAEFQVQGDASGTQYRNGRARDRAAAQVKRLNKEIEKSKKIVEQYEAAMEAIDMYSVTAFA